MSDKRPERSINRDLSVEITPEGNYIFREWVTKEEAAEILGLPLPMSEWINIKDRLPEIGKHVLVFSKNSLNSGVFRAYQQSKESWSCWPTGSYAGDGCVFGITHWMPLPMPPEDK